MKFNGIRASSGEKEMELMWLLITIVAGCNHWKSRCKTEKRSLFIAYIRQQKRLFVWAVLNSWAIVNVYMCTYTWILFYPSLSIYICISLQFCFFFVFSERERKRDYNVKRIERLNKRNTICSNNNNTTGTKNQLPACDQCVPWPLWW